MTRWIVIGLFALIVSFAGGISPAHAQSDGPIAGRVGGTGGDFTSKYGQPVKSTEAPGLDGAAIRSHDVFGFAEVRAIVFEGDVVGLTLRPVVGDTWTAEAAQIVLNDFGPDDAEYDVRQSIGPSETGFRTAAQATSEAIEDALDEDLYEDLDLGGDPGDFFVVYYQSPTPMFYSALSITLGTVGERDAIAIAKGIPQPEVGVADNSDDGESTGGAQPLTADEMAYAAQVADIAGDVADASGRLGDLFTNFEPADYFDLDWQIDVAAQIFVFQSSYDTALAIVPPPAFAEMHVYFLSSLQKYDQASDLLIYGIDNLDPTALDQAVVLIESAAADIAIANALLTQIRDERGI